MKKETNNIYRKLTRAIEVQKKNNDRLRLTGLKPSDSGLLQKRGEETSMEEGEILPR